MFYVFANFQASAGKFEQILAALTLSLFCTIFEKKFYPCM